MDAIINVGSIWESKRLQENFFQNIFSSAKQKSKKIATPAIINEKCNGVTLGNFFIKSLIFSTDMALIENNDSDAILAVYPFPPSTKIMKGLIEFSEKPVICGVGGGLTQGKVSLEMAVAAESMGAAAIIVNQPFKNKHIETIKRKISIPIISSVSIMEFSFRDRVNAGVDVFHVTGGSNTASIIEHIKYATPCYPIIATGGKTIENIQTSIHAGADAIVLTPPSSGELFKTIMNQYRTGYNKLKNRLKPFN
ncbi:MAG: hydrolase [Bacteroidales bacterium]|nr:hydrolase [Bacteroidales bacterium]